MNTFQNIILLAAGKSTRFFPLSDKNLFTFQNHVFIETQLKRMSQFAKNVYVIANSDNVEQITAIAQEIQALPIRVVIQKGEGQAAGLLATKESIAGEAVVLNTIDLFDEEPLFNEIFQKKDSYNLILVGRKSDTYFPGGYLKLASDKLIGVVEKPDKDKVPSAYFKLVVDYYKDFPAFLKILETTRSEKDDVYEESINQYINAYTSGMNAYMEQQDNATFIEYKGYWHTLKYSWQVLDVSRFFLDRLTKSHIGKNVHIDKTARIEGNVYIDDNVKIFGTTKIVGPCFIGKNTVIGDYSMVRESEIGNDCLIGGYSEVTRSYLGQKVYLHRNYIGDSVLENKVLFGAGALTANFRFDEQAISSTVKGKIVNTQKTKFGCIIGSDVKVGVSASLMPGIKIKSGTRVMPGTVLKEDVL